MDNKKTLQKIRSNINYSIIYHCVQSKYTNALYDNVYSKLKRLSQIEIMNPNKITHNTND